MINDAVRIANTTRTPSYIQKLNGDVDYYCFVHYSQFEQLIEDTSDANQFRNIYLAKLSGGAKMEGMKIDYIDWRGVRIIPTDKIPYGVHSGTSAEQTNVRRAIFVGKNAGCLAFGKGYSMGGKSTPGFSFKSQAVDTDHWTNYSINSVFGIKKTQFNSADYGTIVIPTYVA